MNIYEKLLGITSELTKVAKKLQVGEGKFAYKAVGEADVLAAVRPLEERYKVYSFPVKRTVIESGNIENTNYKGEVKKCLFIRIETVYRFVNTEKPDEFVDITTYGDGVDSQDKAVGKAMTYSDKYGLMKAYKIMTGDDPDQNPSGDLNGYNKKSAQPKQTESPKATKMTDEQSKIINGLDDKLKNWLLKKFNLTILDELSAEQASWFIEQINKKAKE